MPRTAQEIFDRAEELASRFEHHEPDEDNIKDATALREVSAAFLDKAGAERRLAEAVARARDEGHSWSAIGVMLGTSGEAARQRHGNRVGVTDLG